MKENFLQIAIDGPAASGKSTAARRLAEALGGYYVNTGDMYRAVAWKALQAGLNPTHQQKKIIDRLAGWEVQYQVVDKVLQLYMNGEAVQQKDIRTPEVAAAASQVASIPEVREWMLEKQRQCRTLGLIIMEGRDIGTVVLPEAKCKIFLTASPEERAKRRLQQKGEVTQGATLETVAAEIAARDRRDATREVAPLKPADDAKIVLTDGLEVEETTALLLDLVKRKLEI